jgi:hypothetical protein
MSFALRMFRFAIPILLLTAVQVRAANQPPAPWSERHGSFVLPAENGAQLALVAFVNRATHRVTYGFRALPQRMNCSPATLGRGQLYDIEGQRISFSKECFDGSLTYIPRNVPAKRAFEQLLAGRRVLHVRTPSFFPITFDISGLPVVRQKLEVAAAAGKHRDG